MRRCKVCNDEALSRRFTIAGYDIWRCRACGFGQVFIRADELTGFYDEAYFRGERANFAQPEESLATPAHGYWIERQLRAFPRGTPLRILEVGPGPGGPIAEIGRAHV